MSSAYMLPSVCIYTGSILPPRSSQGGSGGRLAGERQARERTPTSPGGEELVQGQTPDRAEAPQPRLLSLTLASGAQGEVRRGIHSDTTAGSSDTSLRGQAFGRE